MTLMSNVGCMVEAHATIIVCYLWSDVILISSPPPPPPPTPLGDEFDAVSV